jgi:DNA-binding Lrp family transcriptional regulator
MGVWAVPEDRLEEIGPQMAGFALVSHCYRRPTYDDWPYSVFTMVHGKNAKECETTIAAIRDETGIDEYALLWSIKEYKKTRVRYFTDDWAEWRAEHLPDRVDSAPPSRSSEHGSASSPPVAHT